MTVLSLSNVAVSFGADDIIEGVSCRVNAGDRVGLTGRNGSGKTTLLHVLQGTLRPNAGVRNIARGTTVALVEQAPPLSDSELTVREEALTALGDLLRLEANLHDAADALARGEEGAAEAYDGLHERFEAGGGFTMRARLHQALAGLGFSEDDLDLRVGMLSGGQRSRLGIAKALMASPDVLLMDEPTNHLDFDGLRWLEAFLARRQGTLIVTSHDRYFLDRVAGHIWSLEDRRLQAYRGNYSAFADLRAREIERRQAEHEAQQQYIAKEEAFIRRYRAGQRAREARGRATRLARLQRISAPVRTRDAAIKLTAARSADLVLSAKGLAVGYGSAGTGAAERVIARGEVVLTAGDIELERGARVALVGPNGTGKTTLLKTLAGELAPVGGSVRRGARVQVEHYWQEAENLDSTATVLDELLRDSRLTVQEARDLLGMMLFSGDDVFKAVGALSGGERSRLALARLATSGANLLLLDEPTNHLDIPSREALEAALAAYTGTLIFASHDRRLIATLADRLWLVEGGRLRQFEGTWEEYEDSMAAGREAAPAASPPRGRGASSAPTSRRNEFRRAADVARIETEVDRLERERDACSAAINEASARGAGAEVAALGLRFTALDSELEALMSDWSELHK